MVAHFLEEGVEALCQCLRMTENENEDILIERNLVEDVVARGKHCLLVKLLTGKHYNREAFKGNMKRAMRE